MLDGCEPDCRMATTLIEVCARAGNTERALATYDSMAVSIVDQYRMLLLRQVRYQSCDT